MPKKLSVPMQYDLVHQIHAAELADRKGTRPAARYLMGCGYSLQSSMRLAVRAQPKK